MEALTYKLEQFEGPLDLLLTLIDKNKVSIADIPISIICDQYMEYITEAKNLDMEIAAEFIVMASELMLIKSKMLLPKPEKEEEEDPRAALADALLRYKQAKEAALKMAPLYAMYSGRMIKDTDEITVDKTYVTEQEAETLFLAMSRLISTTNMMEKAEKTHFTPLIQKPIVSVELKIIDILEHLSKKKHATLRELLSGAESKADLIAYFIGVLELIKTRKILIDENTLDITNSAETSFFINTEDSSIAIDTNKSHEQ